jgi:hypothetical protein
MRVFVIAAGLLAFSTSVLSTAQAAQNSPQAAPSPTPAASATPANQPDSQLGLNGPVRAEDVYKDIQVFKGKPATTVLLGMNAIRGNLGVSCTYCHTQYEWEKNDKPAKEKTRKMFDMLGYIEGTYFDHKNKVTCWTCHLGHAEQPHPSEMLHVAENIVHLTPEEEKKPAQEVFKNIQTLKGLPAGRLPLVMNFFSQSLGVKCSHCHVQDQWEKDDVEAKKTARKMLAMVTDVIHKYYGKGGPISCSGCHQGKVKPENGLEKSTQQSAVSIQP